MFGIINLSTYLLGVIFIVLLPGPNSIYVLGLAAQYGTRLGYLGASGIFLGDTILMVLAAVGAASLLRATPHLFMFVQLGGGAYLVWMGFKLLKAAWYQWQAPEQSEQLTRPRVNHHQPFRRALLISLLNPKAILFFVSFFIQFVSPHYPYPLISFVVLGLILQIVSLVYLSLLIFAGVRLAAMFGHQRWLSAGAQGLAGLLFIGFAAKLVTTHLT
jgi:leucine efflux protein